MKESTVFEVKQNYGFKSIKNSFLPFLISVVIFYMDRYNSELHGAEPGGTGLYVFIGFLVLLGLIALLFRRKVVFDSVMQKVTTQWRLLFFDVKSKYPMSEIVGVEFRLGNKPDPERPRTSARRNRDDYYLYLNMNSLIAGEPEYIEHDIHLFDHPTKEVVEKKGLEVAEFLGRELVTNDYRHGFSKAIDKAVSKVFGSRKQD